MLKNKLKTVHIKNVKKHYKQRKPILSKGAKNKQIIKSVDGISFSLKEGEILGVIGESGCGKSTLGRLLANLEEPTSGEITLRGKRYRDLYQKDRLGFRRMVQMIFQNPFDSFNPRDTIQDILTRTLKLHKIGRDDSERLSICSGRMEGVGLSPASEFLSRYPHELSGGQLQRVSILRSMLLDPIFVIADEPVSMLDTSIQADIINLLIDLCEEENTAMMFISHDITITRYISDRIAVMYLGRIVEIGPTDEVLHNPLHPYTRALISNSTQIDDSFEKRDIIQIQGEPPSPVNTGPGCYFYSRCYQRRESCRTNYPDFVDVGNDHKVSCPYI